MPETPERFLGFFIIHATRVFILGALPRRFAYRTCFQYSSLV